MKNLKSISIFTLVILLLCTSFVFAGEINSSDDKSIAPRGGTATWRFIKSSDNTAIDYSKEAPISAYITGPGYISSTTEKNYSATFNATVNAELSSKIKATVNLTLKDSTSTKVGYRLQEKSTARVRMWYAPQITTIRGVAELWATPGGMIERKNIIAQYPGDAGTTGHYYLSSK